MKRKRPAKEDPLEREIEPALNPGAFIPDRACFRFASALDELASRIAKLEATDLARGTEDPALESLSRYTTEPIAKKLEQPHPDLASRLWRAQGMRVINAGRSKHYDAALANFRRAKRCYERAGLVEAWNETVVRVRAEHRRKIGFMSGFERLVAGTAPRHEPSFLERAKAQFSHVKPTQA